MPHLSYVDDVAHLLDKLQHSQCKQSVVYIQKNIVSFTVIDQWDCNYAFGPGNNEIKCNYSMIGCCNAPTYNSWLSIQNCFVYREELMDWIILQSESKALWFRATHSSISSQKCILIKKGLDINVLYMFLASNVAF